MREKTNHFVKATIVLVHIYSILSGPVLCSQDINKELLELSISYPKQGGYFWSSTGCPEALVHGSDTLLRKSEFGTYCSGYTFTLFFRVLKSHGFFDTLSLTAMRSIQQNWFGNTSDSREKQCQYVIEKWNFGKKVSIEEARPGDFVQFWRNNNTGHSALFLGWQFDEQGKVIGMQYRSSQKKTNGIGDMVESVGAGIRSLNLMRIYLCRARPKE